MSPDLWSIELLILFDKENKSESTLHLKLISEEILIYFISGKTGILRRHFWWYLKICGMVKSSDNLSVSLVSAVGTIEFAE